MSTIRVKVVDGYGVFDGDRQRTGGDVLDVDADTAKLWIANGWAELVKSTTRT